MNETPLAPTGSAAASRDGTDALLAAALCGPVPWPPGLNGAEVADRALYHGIAGSLMQAARNIDGWPATAQGPIRQQALSQGMWEARHQRVVADLLAALHTARIGAVLLKGTALAYTVYAQPASRARGDTDVLIAPAHVDAARGVLRSLGFAPFYDADSGPQDRRQEPWTLDLQGQGLHTVDLHWSVLNSPLLDRLLPVETALAAAQPVPSLGPHACALPHDLALLHACIHRAKHVTSPYFVGPTLHYGGDRLIWLVDIDLLLSAMSRVETERFIAAASDGGVGPLCGDTLAAARAMLGTPVADEAIDLLRRADIGPAGRYLDQRQQGRALQDVRAVPGMRGRLRYLARRMFPPGAFMRAKYPGMAGAPLALLYLRRFASFWRARPQGPR